MAASDKVYSAKCHRHCMIIFVTIFISVIKNGMASQCPPSDSTPMAEFDPLRQMCCSGVIYNIRYDIQPVSCCGQGFYNPASQTCCNGQVLDEVSDPDLRCCRSTDSGPDQAYDNNSQLCCQGTLSEKTEDSACCGRWLINTSSQTCCSDGTQLSPREGLGKCCGTDKLYNPTTEKCCQNRAGQSLLTRVHPVGNDAIIDEDMMCCGLAVINTTQQRCCNEVPNAKTSYNKCCGQTTFDLRSQVCCQETISALEDGRTECCNTHPYNPANEVCCGFGQEVFPTGHGKCCRAKPYSPLLESCCSGGNQSLPSVDGVQACCRSQSFLKTDHLCCGGNLFERGANTACCGANNYNTSTELCCNNVKLNRASPFLQCCGSTSYDPRTETCCPKVSQTFPGTDLSCCYAKAVMAASVFDPSTQTCCKGRINVGVYQEPNKTCCGQHLLPEHQLCDRARGQPIDKTHSDDNEVCRPLNRRNGRTIRGGALSTYNREKYVCTTAGILMIRVEGEEVCAQSLYSPDSELCCAGQIYPKQDQYGNDQQCCGRSVNVYAPRLQCCFAGRVFNIKPELAGQCRNTVYNTNTSLCDKNGIVRLRSEAAENPGMCGTADQDLTTWTPYNPAANECCGNVLIGPGQTCCGSAVYDTPGTSIGSGQCCQHDGGFNPDTHICCNGRIFPTNERAMECCGTRPYEPSSDSHTCCGNRLHSTADGRTLCTDSTAHSLHETVCEGIRYGVANGECCGKNVMDDTKICCQGFMYSKSDHGDQCCGKVAYNPQAQPTPLCCQDTLHADSTGLQCCGNQAINPHEHQCHGTGDNSYAFPRSLSRTSCSVTAGDYDSSKHTCCQGWLHRFVVNGQCCGNDVVRDENKEICCGDYVQMKSYWYGKNTICCNRHILDGRRFLCCGDASLQRWPNKHQECCNGVIFNAKRQECVDGDVRPKNREATTDGQRRTRQTEHNQRFTRDATDIYDGLEQTTDVNGPTSQLHERMVPVDSTLVDLNTEPGETTSQILICGAVRYDRIQEGCCNSHVYNLSSEYCYNDTTVIQKISARSTTLVTSTIYNDATLFLATEEPCHIIRARANASEELQCCGSLLFDPQNATCCRSIRNDGDGTTIRWSVVNDGITNGRCCDGTAYDPLASICCNWEIINKTQVTQDMFSGCCPQGERWNRFSETCEVGPTPRAFVPDGPSGMDPGEN